MTPSFMGRCATMESGVRPSISFASWPTAMIVLSVKEIATTVGSLITIPFFGTNTRVLAVPKSIPIFCKNILVYPLNVRTDFLQSFLQVFISSVHMMNVANFRTAACHDAGNHHRHPHADIVAVGALCVQRARANNFDPVRVQNFSLSAHLL